MVAEVKVDPALYPFEGNAFDVGGLDLHYLDEGEGDAVVMVHGNPTWSFYYRELIQELRLDHRVVVPDHIGCGRSDKPGDDRYPYTLARRVEDLTALLDHLALRDVTLVVHDWGGMIGMAWAVRHAERVKRLIILNTAAFPKPATKKMPWSLTLAREWSLGTLLVRGFNAFSRGATRAATTHRLPRRVRDAYCAPYDSWANRIATLRFVQDIPLSPADPAWAVVAETEAGLAQFVDTPTLICWGEQDFVFDHHFLAVWQQHLPHAEVERYADAGHYVLEDARDAILPRVRRFLADHPLER
ncbi:MAG: alpha/beta fold hydrolase [bacterium]